MNKHMTYYTAEEATELLKFMINQLAPKSRNNVKSMLARGQYFVDGNAVTQYNHPLRKGQKVGDLSNEGAKKTDSLEGVKVFHEVVDLIVIENEACILSVAGRDHVEDTIYRQVIKYVQERNRRNRVFVVHSLDRDTSGVMIYAKPEEIKEK